MKTIEYHSDEDDLGDQDFKFISRREKIFRKITSNIEIVEGPLPTPCWIWQGGHSGEGRGGGYPRMSLDGATVAVHRTMFINEHGAIPPRKQIDHRCKRRMCVNPQHLEMVTHKANQKRRDTELHVLKEQYE